MAKRLLLNVLLNVLGDFIDGLTEENLKLAVWSGEVVLENLSINKRLLRRLNAPFALRHGVIRRLELVVPWGSLESSPVRVLVDGVFVGLEPLNLSELDPEQVRQTFLASKFLKLDEADKTLLPSDSEESATYFQRLSAKIVGEATRWQATVCSPARAQTTSSCGCATCTCATRTARQSPAASSPRG